MELKQYWSIVWKWMWLIVLSTGIAAVSSYWTTSQSPKIYQASTTLLIGQSLQSSGPNTSDVYASQQVAPTYIQVVKMEPVLGGVVDALGLRMSTDQLRGMVSAASIPNTQLVELRAVDTDPRRAQVIADELAHQLILQGPAAKENEESSRRDFVLKQSNDLQQKMEEAQKKIDELQGSIQVTSSAREIADKQQQSATLQSQIQQWQLAYTGLLSYLAYRSPNYLSVMEPAKLPVVPIAPNIPTSVMLAAAIGCMLAVGAAFLIEYIDDTIKVPDDVTQSLKTTPLAVVARISGKTMEDKLIAATHPRSSHAEAYRMLRTNIQVADVDTPVKTILVTSPNPTEGKSVTAANLAVVMAQAGLRTVLVDADLRRPVQHRMFHLTNDVGLTSGLVQFDPSIDGYVCETKIENLRVVPTGQLPPNPAEILGSKRMQKLVGALKADFDMIIFDSPPCLPLADAAILARQVDGVLLVVDAGNTRRDAVLQAKETLERAGGHILGVILNRASVRGNGYYYYYYYYYSQGGGRKPKSKQRSSPFSRLFGKSNHRELSPENDGPSASS